MADHGRFDELTVVTRKQTNPHGQGIISEVIEMACDDPSFPIQNSDHAMLARCAALCAACSFRKKINSSLQSPSPDHAMTAYTHKTQTELTQRKKTSEKERGSLHMSGKKSEKANSTLTATLVPQIFLYSYRNLTKFNSGRVEGTKVMLDATDKKEKEQNRASLKLIIDTTIFCGENEIPLRGHRATSGRKPFRKGGQFSSVARVQMNLTVGKFTGLYRLEVRLLWISLIEQKVVFRKGVLGSIPGFIDVQIVVPGQFLNISI
ncbi:hypothetical protein J6590_030326 [Homalodisca vitripennis]|nr:hypothetical protein J6590_030326 [Homalodisca vitripennis]